MISRNTIALSLAAVLVSTSAAMAAPTHRQHTVVHQRAAQDTARDARSTYAAAPSQRAAGPYYFESDDFGSVWTLYPGYKAD